MCILNKLQLIIALMKFHAEAKEIALLKIHRPIEEDCDPLVQLFRRKKSTNFQCYNCKERGHVMKNCPYSPTVIMRKRHELTSELKNILASKFGVSSYSNSSH